MEKNGKIAISTPQREATIALGGKILLSRRRAGFSQEVLANACNYRGRTALSRDRIGSIERGETEATWLEIIEIANILSKDLNEFLV